MVGKFWEDKWEYENYTYFVGDPLEKSTSCHSFICIIQHYGNYLKLSKVV